MGRPVKSQIHCHSAPASLIHMLWACSLLFSYWSEIFSTISKVLNVQCKPNADTALFGILPLTEAVSILKSSFVPFLTLLARRLIVPQWKSPAPPTHSLWIRNTLHNATLEHVRWTLKGQNLDHIH